MGDIGTRIREARRTLNLSQADLAAVVGVSRPQVYKWESGRDQPGSDKVQPLCLALALPAAYLLTGDGRAEALLMQEQRLREMESREKPQTKPTHRNEEAQSLRLRAQQIHDRLAKSMMDVQDANLELQAIISRIAEIERQPPKKN